MLVRKTQIYRDPAQPSELPVNKVALTWGDRGQRNQRHEGAAVYQKGATMVTSGAE